MRFFQWAFFIFLLIGIQAKAQLNYEYQNSIPVNENGIELSQPFAGGLVAPQFSTIDLNNDGVEDLFMFDRASRKISTFLYLDGVYVYSPQYESSFPSGMENWALLRDYNCDGKEDIFTSSLFGMSLYENTSTNGELSWTLKEQTIYTEGSSGQINLQVSGYDLPAITDVDGDGDLDILNFNFATGGGIEFNMNMSVENSGSCGLDLVRTTKRYGEFEECTCETYVFGSDDCSTGGRENHSGGKTILSFDGTGNGVQDLMIGQEYCLFPGFIENVGTTSVPQMTNVNFNYPDAALPLRMELPAYFEWDVDHDGINDLVAAPNKYLPDGTQNYTALLTYYKGLGNGSYSHVSDTFLKDQMIDVGDKASPAFADIDFDGDEDLLVGSGINGEGASLWLYKNTGTAIEPSFELVSNDFLNLKTEALENIHVQFLDVNDDGEEDLILYEAKAGVLTAQIYLHTGNQLTPFSNFNMLTMPLPSNSVWDMPFLFLSGSGFGLLIGKQEGNLAYYTLSGGLTSGNWQLVSDTYLDLVEDFTKRNLRVCVADFNANGTMDMLSIDDSEEVKVYDNFLSKKDPQPVKGFDNKKQGNYGFRFGSQANPAIGNLYNTKEPMLAVGLLQGGVLLFKNKQQTEGEGNLVLKVVSFPNPVENRQLLLQSNKSGTARILDSTGKQVLDPFEIVGGEQVHLELPVLPGLYILEVTSLQKEKSTTRVIVVH